MIKNYEAAQERIRSEFKKANSKIFRNLFFVVAFGLVSCSILVLLGYLPLGLYVFIVLSLFVDVLLLSYFFFQKLIADLLREYN